MRISRGYSGPFKRMVTIHQSNRTFHYAKKGDNSHAALVEGLNGLLADHIALWLKTKNFHWHVPARVSATCTCC